MTQLKEAFDNLPTGKSDVGSHYFVDPTNFFKPKGYIIITYSGTHYRLVEYNKQTFFSNFRELPKKLQENILNSCGSDTGGIWLYETTLK